MIKEFQKFLAERNMMDLAVGVIIGGAFTTIIKSFVDNLINPLIGVFVSKGALQSLSFQVANATFHYGSFLNDVLSFLITAFIVFLIIKSINRVFGAASPKKTDEQLDTLKEIRDLLKK